jgi:signal transduction histidine kinase
VARQRRSLRRVRSIAGAPQLRPAWLRYAGAAVLTASVVAGRLALDPWWGRQHNRHLVFLPTVMLAAWLGGFGPGLLASALSTLALSLFWTDPGHGFRASVDLVLFLCVSLAICLLVQSLHAARARAESARQAREELLAVVAHDLRNPLNAIKMSSASVQQAGVDAETVRRRIRIIDRAVLRMDDLIRDLVDAARIEHGELTVATQAEEVASMVQEVIDLHSPLALESGVTLEAEVSGGRVLVSCDRHRLLQVLGNLVANAIKFTPDGGRVTVRVDEQDRAVRFAVEDTGPGIKREHLPHLFERYWNADSRGIGLGLYIAQTIVRAHGGEIAVRSEPGQGASFFFTLPRSPALEIASSP